MPCGPLIEFRETKTHLRVPGGCHVLTFSGRGVTPLDYCIIIISCFHSTMMMLLFDSWICIIVVCVPTCPMSRGL